MRLFDRLCRLCHVATQRSAKKLSKSARRRVTAALESFSPKNDGARKQVKVQAVVSDTPRVLTTNSCSHRFVGRVSVGLTLSFVSLCMLLLKIYLYIGSFLGILFYV